MVICVLFIKWIVKPKIISYNMTDTAFNKKVENVLFVILHKKT